MFTRPLPTPKTGTLNIDKQQLTLPDAVVIIVGRGGDTQAPPDVDLNRFDAHNRGVSRRHVQIRRASGGLWVADLKSSNGTWLNGKRLTPLTEYPLHDGDELKFGDLTVTVQI